jgi:hypothetical protein
MKKGDSMVTDNERQLLYYAGILRDQVRELLALLREVMPLLPNLDGADAALRTACAVQMREAQDVLAIEMAPADWAQHIAFDRAVYVFADFCAEVLRRRNHSEGQGSRRFARGEIQTALAQYEAAIRAQREA